LLRQFTGRFGQGDIPVELVTDEVIDSFAIAGSPAHCRKKLAEVVAAGVDVPIAYEIPGAGCKDSPR
jgi:alkanesulfonate monooxygenase SsuD/methylene tetrahydromethanopterin reductase-like flavin-dependent oxidoreductase (luciferase family)